MSAQWTVMVYMAGNNSLSDAAGDDLEEMRQVGSSDEVSVFAFVKQADEGGARRILLGGPGGDDDEIEELGDVDSGDPQTVIDFVAWANGKAPAERQALVLWNHGGGWRPGDFDQFYSEVHGPTASRDARSEINSRAAQSLGRMIFSTGIKKIVALPTRGEREICADDGSGHSLDTIELGNVCVAVAEELGHPLDLLGMDACLMSNLEVAYQVRGQVTNIVGSEELEPGAGWPYQTVLADLAERPEMDGADLGRVVVERYIESYTEQEGVWPVTQCAVVTAKTDALADAVGGLAGGLLDDLDEGWPALMSAQSNAVRFELDLVDLASLCGGLAASGLSDDTKAAAEAVVAALEPGDYVIAEGHLGDQVEGCKGVSVYLPAPTDPVSQYYKDLEFAKANRWDEVLDGYGRAVRGGA